MKRLGLGILAVAALAAGAAPAAQANSPYGTVKCVATEGTALVRGVVADPEGQIEPTDVHINC